MWDTFFSRLSDLQPLGPWAPVLFGLFFIVANSAMVPATTLAIAAGYSFEFSLALVLSALCRPTAAGVGFALSRTWLRRYAQRLTHRYAPLDALDQAISSGGLRVVLLLRLSPLFPSTVTNYLLGTTRVRTIPFLVGSALGTLPSSLMCVWAGAALNQAVSAPVVGPDQRLTSALTYGGLLATAVLLIWLFRRARHGLKIRLEESLKSNDDNSRNPHTGQAAGNRPQSRRT